MYASLFSKPKKVIKRLCRTQQPKLAEVKSLFKPVSRETRDKYGGYYITSFPPKIDSTPKKTKKINFDEYPKTHATHENIDIALALAAEEVFPKHIHRIGMDKPGIRYKTSSGIQSRIVSEKRRRRHRKIRKEFPNMNAKQFVFYSFNTDFNSFV